MTGKSIFAFAKNWNLKERLFRTEWNDIILNLFQNPLNFLKFVEHLKPIC